MRLHPTHPLSNTNKTYSSIGPPSLSSKNILNLSGSWQSVRNLANEIYTRPELKEQFSATRYEIDWDTDEEEDEEDEEESANLFRRKYTVALNNRPAAPTLGYRQTNTHHDALEYRPRLIDPQSKPPSFTSSTLDPSLYPWRQFPIPPYHPGYMGNGYPPGVPTIPLPMPVPTPAPAPVNGNTGSAISPIPRLSRSKSCKKHRKARVSILPQSSSFYQANTV